MLALEIAARRKHCEENSLYFTRYFLKLRLGGKMVLNPHHRIMQDTLDRTILPPGNPDRISRLIINVPPGYTKCSVYDTMIQTNKGGVMVQDVRVGDEIRGFEGGRAVYRKVTGTETHRKDCVEIGLLSGRTLGLSFDHPVLTQRGWVEAGDLCDDHYLIRYCQEYDGPHTIDDDELDFITLMLFEGCCTDKRNPRFTNSDDQIVNIFRGVCNRLGVGVKKYESSREHDYNLDGGLHGKASQLLSGYGINGKLAIDKRLPFVFFALPLRQKYRFLSLMVATDGFITKNHGQVCITLGSEGLIDDIGLLIDSCGIPSYKYARQNGHAGVYTLVINPSDSKKLLGKVNFLQKQKKFERVCGMREKRGSLIFGYPPDVTKGLTYKCKLARPRINLKYNRPITEHLFGRIKNEIDHNISRFEMADFIYDRVKTVSSAGVKKVVHLSVDANNYDNKNYLANNLVVHNTEMAVIHYMARGMALNNRCRFLHVSYSSDLALLNSSITREIVRSLEFQAMWPVYTKDDTKSKKLWRTNYNGGVRAASAGGQVTGFRAGQMQKDRFTGALIIDDPIKPDDAHSVVKRSAINDSYQETVASRLAVEEVPIIVIMQRVHYDDLSGFLLRGGSGEQWHHLNMPVMIEPGYEYPEENTHGIPIEHGLQPGWLWPYKHNNEHSAALRSHRRKWASQYMQAPPKRDEEQMIWQESDINLAHGAPWKSPTRTVVAVDPAATNTKTSDEHGITAATHHGGDRYSVDVDFTRKGSPKQWADTAIYLHNSLQAAAIVIETNQGGDMAVDTLRNAGFKGKIIRVHASKGKVARAEPIAALYAQGFVRHAPGMSRLETEMLGFDPVTGLSNKKSPNRVDSVVWALTELSKHSKFQVS